VFSITVRYPWRSAVVISKEGNELFGEMAWLSGKKRTASIRCHGRREGNTH